jgi:hypothetical protein
MALLTTVLFNLLAMAYFLLRSVVRDGEPVAQFLKTF